MQSRSPLVLALSLYIYIYIYTPPKFQPQNLYHIYYTRDANYLLDPWWKWLVRNRCDPRSIPQPTLFAFSKTFIEKDSRTAIVDKWTIRGNKNPEPWTFYFYMYINESLVFRTIWWAFGVIILWLCSGASNSSSVPVFSFLLFFCAILCTHRDNCLRKEKRRKKRERKKVAMGADVPLYKFNPALLRTGALFQAREALVRHDWRVNKSRVLFRKCARGNRSSCCSPTSSSNIARTSVCPSLRVCHFNQELLYRCTQCQEGSSVRCTVYWQK